MASSYESAAGAVPVFAQVKVALVRAATSWVLVVNGARTIGVKVDACRSPPWVERENHLGGGWRMNARNLGQASLHAVVVVAALAVAVWAQGTPAPSGGYQPRLRLWKGDGVVVLYFTASKCGNCGSDSLQLAVERMKILLAERAKSNGLEFSAVGIAQDWDPMAGVEHLKKHGQFDEIASGNNWQGMATIHYLWRDHPGPPSLPQVVVIRRSLSRTPASMTFGADLVLLRKVGSIEILDWVARGATLTFSTDQPGVPGARP
jgi:hypothetical protein